MMHRKGIHIVRELRLLALVFFRVYGNRPNGRCHIYPGMVISIKWLLLPTGDEVHALYDCTRTGIGNTLYNFYLKNILNCFLPLQNVKHIRITSGGLKLFTRDPPPASRTNCRRLPPLRPWRRITPGTAAQWLGMMGGRRPNMGQTGAQLGTPGV